jgi:hypothetical protein
LLSARSIKGSVGPTFGEMLYEFDTAVPIGIMGLRHEQCEEGDLSNVIVNPPDDRVLKPGDKLLFVARSSSDAMRRLGSTLRPVRHLDQTRGRKRPAKTVPCPKVGVLLGCRWASVLPIAVAVAFGRSDATLGNLDVSLWSL